MANVVRFTLPTARDLTVPGAGFFNDGVLDVDANDLRAVKRARYLTPKFGAIEVGTVASTTPPPALPAVPAAPNPDPYPQYVTDQDLDNPASGPMVKLRAAIDAEMIARGPGVLESARYQNLPTPNFSAHRCNLAIYPENTLESIRSSMATGSVDINVDTYPLADGGVGVIHDDTTDRTTPTSASVTDLDSSTFQQLVIDTATWFQPNSAWGNLKAPLGEQVFREFGNKVHLGVEAKPFAGSGAALVKVLQRFGIHPDTCNVASFLMSELVAPHAAGYQTAYICTAANHSTTDPAALVAAGVDAVVIDPTAGDLQTQAARVAEVNRFKSAGLQVAVSVFQRRWELWPWLSTGATVFGVDDDAYMNHWLWKPRTSDPFKSGNVPRGHLPYAGTQSYNKGTYVGDFGRSRWQAPAGANWTHRGDMGPIKGAIESSLQAAVSVGATSIRTGPANKPIAGVALTLDGPPSSTRSAAVGSGGTFAAGTYFWAATAVTASGESIASVETSAAIVANGSATITGVAPIGATAINIYRGTATGAENVLVGQATVATANRRADLTVPTTFTFTDTGAVGTAQTPPTTAAATEVVTPTGDGAIQSDGTYAVAVPALAKAHAAGTRVYGGTWTITASVALDAAGSDTSRWVSIVCGSPDDQKFDTSASVYNSGYNEQIRINGQLTTSPVKCGAGVAPNGTNIASTQAIASPIVLSADLVSGVAITALPITAAASAIVSGQKFVLPNGQTATASAGVAASATSVPISSLTPSRLIASGTTLSAFATISVQRTATQLIFKRTDLQTQYTVTVNDTAFFGGYFHLGQLDNGAGMLASWFNISIVTP